MELASTAVATLSSYTNEDGTFLDVRDARGLKCTYRCDTVEVDVSLELNIQLGNVAGVHIVEVTQ